MDRTSARVSSDSSVPPLALERARRFTQSPRRPSPNGEAPQNRRRSYTSGMQPSPRRRASVDPGVHQMMQNMMANGMCSPRRRGDVNEEIEGYAKDATVMKLRRSGSIHWTCFKQGQLQVLDIQGAKVGVIPFLSCTETLQKVKFISVGFLNIPEWFQHCPSLKKIVVRDPRSIKCVEHIFSAPHLEHVEIASIQFELPTCLSHEAAKVIIISSAITALPQRLRLPALQRLEMERNEIETIPSSLGACTNLTYLSFAHSKVQSFALKFTFVELTHLKVLDLRDNEFEVLPPGLEALQALEEVYLQDNCLESIGMLSACLSLRKVDISNNPLGGLPDEFFELPNLKWIKILSTCSLSPEQQVLLKAFFFYPDHYNRHYRGVRTKKKADIGKLRLDLTAVGVSTSVGVRSARGAPITPTPSPEVRRPLSARGSLESITDEMQKIAGLPSTTSRLSIHEWFSDGLLSRFKFLQQIDFSNCRLGGLNLEHVEHLRNVNLSHNIMIAVPRFLEQATGVEMLDLSHNQINDQESVSRLAKLVNIRVLDISHNNICELPEAAHHATLESISFTNNPGFSFSANFTRFISTFTQNGNAWTRPGAATTEETAPRSVDSA